MHKQPYSTAQILGFFDGYIEYCSCVNQVIIPKEKDDQNKMYFLLLRLNHLSLKNNNFKKQ